MAVVLGGQGERSRAREEGRVPGLLHHCLSGCCWVPWNAVLAGPTSFGGKMLKTGSRQAQWGQLDTPVLTSPPIPPGIACTQGGHGCTALPRGRDEQVGSEGLTSALGVDAAGPAGEDEWIRVLPNKTHPG